MHIATHRQFIVMLLVSLLAMPASSVVVAGTTSVVNTVSVSSNTGGQNASNGTVSEGKSTASVDIYTVIDGEVVEDTHETVTNDEYVRIDKTATATSTNARVQTNVLLQAGAQTEAQDTEDATTERRTPITSTSTLAPSIEDDAEFINSNDGNTDQDSQEIVEEMADHTSLFTRVIESVTRTIAYVLSKLFT